MTGPNFRLRLDEPSGLWCVVRCEDGVALQATPWGEKPYAVRRRYELVVEEEARQRVHLRMVASIGPSRYSAPRPAPRLGMFASLLHLPTPRSEGLGATAPGKR